MFQHIKEFLQVFFGACFNSHCNMCVHIATVFAVSWGSGFKWWFSGPCGKKIGDEIHETLDLFLDPSRMHGHV